MESFELDYVSCLVDGEPAADCAQGPLVAGTVDVYLMRANADLAAHGVVSPQLLHELLLHLNDDSVIKFFRTYVGRYKLIPHSLEHVVSAVMSAWPCNCDFFFTTPLAWPYSHMAARGALKQLATGEVEQRRTHYIVKLLDASLQTRVPEDVAEYVRKAMAHYAAREAAEDELLSTEVESVWDLSDDALGLLQESERPIITRTVGELFSLAARHMMPPCAIEDIMALLPTDPIAGFRVLVLYARDDIMDHAAAVLAAMAIYEEVPFTGSYGDAIYTIITSICDDVHETSAAHDEVRLAMKRVGLLQILTAPGHPYRTDPPCTHPHIHCVATVLDALAVLDQSVCSTQLGAWVNACLRQCSVSQPAVRLLVIIARSDVPRGSIDMDCLVRVIHRGDCCEDIIDIIDLVEGDDRDLGPHVHMIMQGLRRYGAGHRMRAPIRAFILKLSKAYPFDMVSAIERVQACPLIDHVDMYCLWLLQGKAMNLGYQRINFGPASKLLNDDPARAVKNGIFTMCMFPREHAPLPLEALMPTCPPMPVDCRDTLIYYLATKKNILPEHMAMLRYADRTWGRLMRRVTLCMPDVAAAARAWNRRRGWGMVVHCLSPERGTKHPCTAQAVPAVYRAVACCSDIACLVASYI